MKEADAAQASNLGQALVPAIAGRFQELTHRRYETIRLTAQLATEGIMVSGAMRPAAQISVGTREQLSTFETRKKRGLSQLRIGCLLRPWLPRRQRRARRSSFKTWSRLGVGDRLRGSHLDQDQVSLSSQPPVFPGLLLVIFYTSTLMSSPSTTTL
jgi:hypothetical protein